MSIARHVIGARATWRQSRGIPAYLRERISRYTRDGDALILGDEKRQARIGLSPQGERVLASVRLPTTLVTFQFVGYSHHEVEAFMRRFDLYFQRGGG
ncbi:MAG: hypothetical protein ACREVE_14205 [Gammaproteobacteria bacterium]